MSARIDGIIAGMTLEQKAGQMLAFGFSGAYPHRDIMEAIEQCHVAGFRVTPHGTKFMRYLKPGSPGASRVAREPERNERLYGADSGRYAFTAADYARTLNAMRRRSLETGAGIPLYVATDFEGNQSADLLVPGIQGFPHPMGLAASGDPSLCRRVARAIARQLKAVGIDALHSPCLDVNTNPNNPEIGTRSYSADAKAVCQYAVESLRGFTEGNIVATAKHFPGRGASDQDVHFDIAVIPESGERMRQIHAAPYRALIAAGLPAIMLAHSIYPALDPQQEIATLSKPVITDFLRGELGFQGLVMTDSFTMGGLVAKYEVLEAALRCIEAGVDLILLKDENILRGEVFHGIVQAVQSGRIKEDRIEQSVRRVLSVKERYGLLDGAKGTVEPETIEAALRESDQTEVAEEAARKSLVVLRDRDGSIPIRPGARVLVAEEVTRFLKGNNCPAAHCGALYEALLERGVDAVFANFEIGDSGKAWEIIARRAKEADVIVHTGTYNRGAEASRDLQKRFLTLGKPTIFVTNSPYREIVLPEMPAVLVTFSPFAASMRAAADVITGRLKPQAKLGFDPDKVY